jgi:hypothetical protein
MPRNQKVVPDEKQAQKQYVKEKDKAIEAHQQADKDIEQDPDLATKPNPEDNLDEGELARLEGED